MMMLIRERLYKASLEGDITFLLELLEEDPLILERVTTSFTETALHIAAMFGHIDFAKQLLGRKPDLISEVDSHGFSLLHLAASRKNIDMVEVLLAAGDPHVCSIIDKEGRTPLHIAAMKGRIEAMKELINAYPGAIHVVADRGETILHLCVKHNRLEALKLLLEELNNNNGGVLGDSSSFYISINSKDDDGNTILHLAVGTKHWESARDLKDIEIGELLNGVGCVRAAAIGSPANNVSISPIQQQIPRTIQTTKIDINDDDQFAKWINKTRTSLMVVASLIATMANIYTLNKCFLTQLGS